MRPTVLGVAAAFGLAMGAVAPMAVAEEVEVWGTAGVWDVLIDHSIGSGCLIQAAFEDGSLIRIGFDREAGDGYVAAFNHVWDGIEAGVSYPITFDIDGQSYDGTANGMFLADVPGVDIHFDNPDFLRDLAKKYTMTLYYDGDEVMAIDLGGTYNGLTAAVECQDEMG